VLLEIENQLHRRIHEVLGQSAVVLRLAEELDESGRVAEQAMIIISYSGESSSNSNKGAYVPTVRTRALTYNVTIIQKQTQREGHSFALPLMDMIYDSVTGWVPPVPGLEFQTGFEPGSGRFVQVTEASQFIYEMGFTVEVNLADGRFYSQPCAAYDPISLGDFLPQRSCLLTPEGKNTGIAIWRRKTGPDTTQEYLVEDSRCKVEISDTLEVVCNPALDGTATYTFIPRVALSFNDAGERVINASKTLTGSLQKVWKCYKDTDPTQPYPPWFKLNIDSSLWRNSAGTVANSKPGTASKQDIYLGTNPSYDKLK
jgi:hypothetical protein